LAVQYDASILQDLIVDQNGLAGPDSFGILVDENQVYLANGQNPDLLYKTVAPLPAEEIEHLISIGRLPNLPPDDLTLDQVEFATALDAATPAAPFFTVGTQPAQQVAVTWLDSQTGWQVSFYQPQEVFLAVIREQTRNTIPLILLSAIIVAIASIGATRIICAPIANLTELVEHIAAGNLSIQVPVVTKDEIGRLAAAFNAMTSQIRGLLGGLENQVSERTRELERRAVQLQTAAQVARDVSTLQDLSALLNRVVNLIHDRFGFYHAGVFLLDERQEYAILQAANSEGGKEMLRRGHRLKVGEIGIVGYVTSRGEPRIALDVDADTTHFAHPLLPETRSEMALPLIVGGKIIGALDVQSKAPNAFDESDIAVLQVLADQLAIAIENSRLLTEVRQTVEELETAYGTTTREAWLKWARRANQPVGYRYRGLDVEPAPEKTPETILAIRQGQIITKVAADPAQNGSSLAIPIQLRGQTFGALHLRIEGDDIPPDLVKLTETIADRLATALESARLYEETQRRAVQEQITSEITTRIRETLDINTMMKTAVQEIGQKLDLHDIAIQIELEDDTAPGEEA
jgi:GAF domain-containing protein/HAMP domain-containing protein